MARVFSLGNGGCGQLGFPVFSGLFGAVPAEDDELELGGVLVAEGEQVRCEGFARAAPAGVGVDSGDLVRGDSGFWGGAFLNNAIEAVGPEIAVGCETGEGKERGEEQGELHGVWG